MNSFRFDIDLRENLLLEASAGTGKTYTLERVVLNLIQDPKYKLDIKDILVVTFTNKATREMKERIRSILQTAATTAEDPEIRERVSGAISDFDEAAIYTIHSFCQNTLQTYPFESGIAFNQDITQDPDLLRKAVWDYLRELESTNSPLIEGFSLFSRGKSFNDSVETLISLFNREEYKECSYTPDSKDLEFLESIAKDFNKDLKFLLNRAAGWSADEFHGASKALKCRTTKKSFEKLREFLDQTSSLDSFQEFIELFYTPGFINNAWKLTSEYLHSKSKDGLTYNDADSLSREIILTFEEIFASIDILFNPREMERYTKKKNPLESIKKAEFITKSLRGIEDRYIRLKDSAGVLSYNDLIDRLHQGINESEPLLNALRGRYKVALIDEFQDTDRKQWDIFSRIFMDSPNHNLLLIGDPKQSIYGFRGADLEIYYKAKRRIKKSNRYDLGTNYRSEKGIIMGCNTLFSKLFSVPIEGNTQKTEFKDVGVPEPPKEEKSISNISQNIEFLEYRGGEGYTSRKSKIGYFKTVVKKSVSLLNDFNNSPGDIAYLVESHKDSGILRDMLNRAGIPAILSRQRNLYHSREAGDISLLLKALISPGSTGAVKSLLLTPLFEYSIEDIHEMERSGGLEEISEMLLSWVQIFNTTGLIPLWSEVEKGGREHLEKRVLSRVNGERSYTNYKHLIEKLNTIQRSQKLTLGSLLESFTKEILNSSEDEENFVRLDREIAAAQIMTIHASKGLEFPIVFFIGGLSSGRVKTGDGIKFFSDEKIWTLDFLAKERSQLLSQRDIWEEKKRLYYVAFTRASSKLYLPLFPTGDLTPLSSFYCSFKWEENKTRIEEIAEDSLTMCSMPIHQQLKASKKGKELKRALSEKIYEDVVDLVSSKGDLFYIDGESQYLPEKEYIVEPGRDDLVFKEINSKKGFRERVTWMSSYSGLTRDSHGSNSKEDADREDDREEEFFSTGEINQFNIPGGATFGDLVHEFFEEVSFSTYKLTQNEFLRDEAVDELYRSLAKKHFDSLWARTYEQSVKTLFWNTLNTKLSLDKEVPLGSFDSGSRIHEMEFYFRVDKRALIKIDGLELRFDSGYLKGFIDLIFIHNGKLYIGDWKTTTIRGHETFENYSKERVEGSMRSHHYHLQGLIYSVALYLYMKKNYPDFDFQKNYGGYYYFYVRGMSGDSDTGLSFRRPGEDEIQDFIRRIIID